MQEARGLTPKFRNYRAEGCGVLRSISGRGETISEMLVPTTGSEVTGHGARRPAPARGPSVSGRLSGWARRGRRPLVKAGHPGPGVFVDPGRRSISASRTRQGS